MRWVLVNNNEGILGITSGSGSIIVRSNRPDPATFGNLPYLDKKNQGTIVDFQIDTSKTIDIANALGGHKPVNFRLEKLETDVGHEIMVREHSHGTGTRRSAEALRNLIVNTINQESPIVIVDFSGIAIISSSFADECIGKLVAKYGFYDFQQLIKLKGMNEAVQAIMHRSVAQRMMESLQSQS